jgi:hypothetical protein
MTKYIKNFHYMKKQIHFAERYTFNVLCSEAGHGPVAFCHPCHPVVLPLK